MLYYHICLFVQGVIKVKLYFRIQGTRKDLQDPEVSGHFVHQFIKESKNQIYMYTRAKNTVQSV